MSRLRLPVAALATVLLAAAGPVPSPLPGTGSYADVAAFGLAAPIALRATIEKAERLGADVAPDVTPGRARVLMTAATTAAIIAPGEVPARIVFLWDAPLDARGRIAKFKGADALLFLRGVAGKPGQFTLVSARGLFAWTPAADATLRSVLTEARAGKVPVITGISSAFRVAGAVPGEAESQFFLTTADGNPVSLVVLTRPGQAQRLTVALGDVIDEAAAGVRRDTLLWYRLACFLPRALPSTVAADDAVATDYRFVLASLGACGRTV